MKKLYIFTLLLIAAFSSKGQYTITSSIAPNVGDIQRTWQADTTGIVAGPAGTNQIWNYLGITVPSTVAVTSQSYVTVNTAPNYTAYPAATMANTSDGINYGMESYGANLTSYGQTSSTLSVIYGNPLTLFAFPFSYGMASSDTYSTMYVSGGSSYVTNGSYTTTADGWGTLNMPGLKSYANTLRIKLQGYATGSITTGTTVVTYTQTSTNYIHICAASKSSILDIATTTTTAKSGTFTNVAKGKTVKVNDIIFTGIREEKLNSSNFSVYPNPAANSANLWFVLTNNESYEMSITNTLGQVVRATSYNDLAPGTYNLAVDLKDLRSGIYYVRLKGKEQEGIQKLIIE